MQGNDKIITFLNQVLKNELTSINQYFLHARMLKNWGLNRLNEHEYQESLDEMRHADELIHRILFLEGLPNLQDLGKLQIGEDVPEVLRNDLNLELAARQTLQEAIAHCESIGDYVTRGLFDNILGHEEEHIDWLETQLELIDKIGLGRYLQSQI